MITDRDGRILTWYLPEVLTVRRRVRCLMPFISWWADWLVQRKMWLANTWLQRHFKGGTAAGNWRSHQDHFRDPTQSPLSMPGEVNISPAWFEMARDVSP